MQFTAPAFVLAILCDTKVQGGDVYFNLAYGDKHLCCFFV